MINNEHKHSSEAWFLTLSGLISGLTPSADEWEAAANGFHSITSPLHHII